MPQLIVDLIEIFQCTLFHMHEYSKDVFHILNRMVEVRFRVEFQESIKRQNTLN